MERGVLVVGESLVDIVQTHSGHLHEYAGGSAANVAVALARLGRPTRLATSFAADRHGEMIAAHLAESGVTLACDPGAVARTSTAQATIGTAGAAEYTFDIDWRLLPVPDDEDPLVAHTCSLGRGAGARRRRRAGAARPAARARDDHLRRQRPARRSPAPARTSSRGCERVVDVADLVKASDEDLEALFPGRPYAESAAALLDARPGRGRGDPRRRRRAAGWTATGAGRDRLDARARSRTPSAPATPSGPG